jgi:YVTN family beta-propeller protein
VGEPERLSGTVTFLFSDIEGSTRLVKQLRDHWSPVLAQHQSLLRAAFAANAGEEIDTQGDSFFVAFSRPRDALLAAVEGQMALRSHRWPEGVEINVRMGIHTGQAAKSEGGYTGLAVHRAARICAAGHGGQVLVSQATKTLLDDEEEDIPVFLRDLGDQRLKDFDRPVRLYQAETGGLTAVFPPLRTATSSGGLAARPFWQRPALIAAAALMLAAGSAAGVLVLTDGSSGPRQEVRPNQVAVIDAETNDVIASVPVGADPGPVIAGAGSVWVGELRDRTLTRVDVQRRSPTRTISLEDRTPTGLAFDAGAVWVAHGLRGQVSRVDPRTNKVTATVDVADPGSEKGAIAAGGNTVWAVFGDSSLARIDTETSRVIGATFAGGSPSAAVLAYGSLWVVNSGDATVTRYDVRTYEGGPVGKPIRVGRKPSAITYAHGAIWVTDTADDAVTRINPNTNDTSTIRVGDGPTAVAAGGGLVWVANTTAGTISRIDPVSNEVTRTINVGNAPSGMVFAGGSLWVAVRAARA